MIQTPWGLIHTVEEMMDMQRRERARHNSPWGRFKLSLRIVRALLMCPASSMLSFALSILEDR